MSLIFFTNSDFHTYLVNVLKLWETLRQVDNFHPIISSVHGAVCPSIFIPQFEIMIQCVLVFSSNKFSLWCSSVASNSFSTAVKTDKKEEENWKSLYSTQFLLPNKVGEERTCF